MPLLVVPLAPEDAGLLTVAELDALVACDLVVFERPDHPLVPVLRERGVPCGPFDDEPEADWEGRALVADPGSERVLELARRGAAVSLGPLDLPDAVTAAHGASVARSAAVACARLAAIMARLRGPDGCPWDREQSHASLQVHLLEEAYEVIEAIDDGLLGRELEEELGDLLLQVFFHARIAAQEGRFDIAGVARSIAAKLIARHPHVFGDVEVAGADEVLANWETIKAGEKQRTGPFEGIPPQLPALMAAAKTQARAARLGFEEEEQAALARVCAALDRLSSGEDCLGEVLFWLVAVARARGVDPEAALRQATGEFRASR